MDYKVADLRKKLNKLKYESGIKTDKLARLMKDFEKVVSMNAEMVSIIVSHLVLFLGTLQGKKFAGKSRRNLGRLS